jgi:hypothetical protein
MIGLLGILLNTTVSSAISIFAVLMYNLASSLLSKHSVLATKDNGSE